MKLNSLGVKASGIVALVIAALIVIVLMILSTQSDELISALTTENARSSTNAFAAEVESLEREAARVSDMIATLHGTIDAIHENDFEELHEEIEHIAQEIDYVTMTDVDGNVITRKHSEITGDNVMNRDIIRQTLETGNSISTVARDPESGNLATMGSAIIRDYDGTPLGAVVCSHDLTNPKYVDNLKAQSNCEATLFDGDTRVNTTLINEQNERVIGTQASDAVIAAVLNNRNDYPLNIELFGTMYAAYYMPLIIDDVVIGMLFTGVDIEHVLASQSNMFNSVLWASIACGIAGIVIVLVFNIFSVNRPLRKIGRFAEKIKAGDLGISSSSVATTGVRSKDEVGMLARTLEEAYNQLKGYVGEISERMNGLQEGNLVTESTYDFNGDFILIKDSINSIIHNLNQIMSEIQESATQVAHGAKQIADGSQTLAQGSTEQAATVEELSSSTAEIASKTKENAEKAGSAAKLSDTIRDNAERGSRQMEEMMAAVNEINEASQNIGKVIKAIDDIAFQTNILALNAAVEAARAGQHGKGFAVVAEEVRNLAAKSAEAASETGNMIQNSIEKAQLGSNIAKETSDSLAEIVSGINESGRIIGEIAKASAEQSTGIAHINTGIDQVAQVVQQNSATAQQSAAASQVMNGQSSTLQELLTQFKLSGKDDYLLGSGK